MRLVRVGAGQRQPLAVNTVTCPIPRPGQHVQVNPLDRLVGGELDTVSFVRDYVELRIGYAIVRAITSPNGIVDGVAWHFDDEGAADVMRRYIGRTVTAVELIEDHHIRLMFGSDAWFRISLRDDDRVGPEAAHFQSEQFNSPDLWIW